MLSGIIQSLIASVVIAFAQWAYKKYKERKERPLKNNFFRNTAIVSVVFQILAALLCCLSIYFEKINKSSLFTICFLLTCICLEQSIINTLALIIAAKYTEKSDKFFNDSADDIE